MNQDMMDPSWNQSLWVHELIGCQLLEAMCYFTLLCGDHLPPAMCGKYDQCLVAGAGAGTGATMQLGEEVGVRRES